MKREPNIVILNAHEPLKSMHHAYRSYLTDAIDNLESWNFGQALFIIRAMRTRLDADFIDSIESLLRDLTEDINRPQREAAKRAKTD